MMYAFSMFSVVVWFITWIIVGKLVFDKLYYKKISLERELLYENNISIGFSFSGFILGFSFALKAAIDPAYPVYINGITGTLIIVLILFITRMFDWIFLKQIDLPTEIVDKKNTAAGIIEGSFFLSMGLVVSGGFSGDDVISWSNMYMESILYCLIGIILLYISSKILSYILKVDMQKELLDNNCAVGASFGGIFISTGIIIKNAISGPVQKGILYDVKITLLDWFISLFIMIMLFFIFDLILFRKFSFREELKEPNIGAGIMIGIIFVSSSLLSSLIIP